MSPYELTNAECVKLLDFLGVSWSMIQRQRPYFSAYVESLGTTVDTSSLQELVEAAVYLIGIETIVLETVEELVA